MTGKTVSVVMSVYNSKRHLAAAIESILNQTMDDFEFLIVDDASTDGSSEILSSYASQDSRISLIQNETNKGLTKSLNVALGRADSPLIARQDADDISEPIRFRRQAEQFQNNPHLLALGSNYQTIDDDDKKLDDIAVPSDANEIAWQMLFHNAFCHSAMMFRRQDLAGQQVTYDETFTYSQDYELWSRLLRVGQVTNLDDFLVRRRVSPESIGEMKKSEQQQCARRIAGQNMRHVAPDISISDQQVERLRQTFYVGIGNKLGLNSVFTAHKLLKLWRGFIRETPHRAKEPNTCQTFWDRQGRSWLPALVRRIALQQSERQYQAALQTQSVATKPITKGS